MSNNYNNIPKELKESNYWVAWKREENNGKVSKVPINPADGTKASVTNPLTWSTFENALSAYYEYKLDGIGFVFTSENPYVGVDIDHCIDENGNMNIVARDIILQLNSYTEYSPSGSGVHVLAKGQLPDGIKRDDNIGLEMYSDKRYFTVTGNITPGSPSRIEERSEAIREVHQKYLGNNDDKEFKQSEHEQNGGSRYLEKLVNKSQGGFVGQSNWTEEEIIEKAKRGKHGTLFEQLYLGNWSPYYKSPSDAELRFADFLAFWTAKDINMMNRIYRMSGLNRAKWDRLQNGSTYGQLTLENAIGKCTSVYDKKKRKNKNHQNIESNKSQSEPKSQEHQEPRIGGFNDEEEPFYPFPETRNNKLNPAPPWYRLLPNGNLKFLPAVLAKHLSENIPVVYAHGQAYKYEKGVYSPTEDIELDVIVKDHLRDDHATMYAIRDVRKQWMIESSRDRVEFDLPSLANIINLRNGLYDIQQQKLFPHLPEYHSLIQLDCAYQSDAKCEQFIEFINEVLPTESVVLAQEIVGYILVPMTQAQKSFVLYGPGGTGKSTFIRILEALIGKQNVSNIAWQDLNEKFLLARLSGKLINTFADLPDRGLKDLGMFKSLTGEDRVTADIKYKDAFEFMNKARLLFSTNHLPQNLGDNRDSFYRRLIILPFENKVPSDKMDARLTEKLIAEKNGILLWAIEGLHRLIENNFKFSENKHTQKILAKYQVESSSVRWFFENNCVFGVNDSVDVMEVYNKYRQSCMEDGITPLDKIKFNNAIVDNYGSAISKGLGGTSRRAIWRGFKLIEF